MLRRGHVNVIPLLLLLLLLADATSVSDTARAEEPDPESVLTKLDSAVSHRRVSAEVRQVVLGREGYKRTQVFIYLAADHGRRQRLDFIEPADIKGDRVLILDHGASVFNYSATTRKVRKLGAQQLHEGIMGSNLTYADLTFYFPGLRYSASLHGLERIKETRCFLLELTPKRARGTEHRKVLVWVALRDFLIRRIDYYRRSEDAEPVRRITAEDIRIVEGKPVPHIFTVSDLEVGEKTINVITKVRFNTIIPEMMFDVRNLAL
jgi:outer membrane lipoprotein-sorting protein